MQQTTYEQTTLTLGTQVKDFAAYNVWANTTLVEWLKTKPADVMDKEVASSFPSIRKTLVHIWNVQQVWLASINKTQLTNFRYDGFDGTLDEVFAGIIAHSQEILDYAANATEEELTAGCSFSMPYVGDHTIPVQELLQHTFNHSTYHRGQVVTIGRHVGLTDAPMTDYMFYLLRAKYN